MVQPADSPKYMLANRYELQETLGSGGMAVVYKAFDTMLERPVAIKVLRQDFSDQEEFRRRFRREAQSAANLSHPNITVIHDFGFDAGRLFIVMEYMPGKDLKTLIRLRQVFPYPEGVYLLTQACAGIGYAHRAGIVHCDIKPHNMLVSEDQRLKVTDFGIARVLATINPEEKSEEVWGSPQYFSPEQARGHAPSPASDVYSLGVVLYETITGRLPFTQTDPQELALAHQNQIPIPPRQLVPEIPAELDAIILKVLAKEPSQRYRSADQLGRVLSPFQESAPAVIQVASPASEALNEPASPFAAPPPPRQADVNPPQTLPPVSPAHGLLTSPGLPPPLVSPPRKRGLLDVMDTGLIILGILTLILLAGLIPFWAYVLIQFGFFA